MNPFHPVIPTAPHASTSGNFSTKYSTIASGPLSTCNPWGIAWVLISGTISLAVCWILADSSGVHIDAQNCSGQNLTNRPCLLTNRFGFCSFTVASTCSIALKISLALDDKRHTICVSYMYNYISVFELFGNTSYQSFGSIRSSINCNESPGCIWHIWCACLTAAVDLNAGKNTQVWTRSNSSGKACRVSLFQPE